MRVRDRISVCQILAASAYCKTHYYFDLNPNLQSEGQVRLQGIFGDAVLADLMTLQVKVPGSEVDPAYDDLPIVFAVTDETVQNCDFIIPTNVLQLIYASHSPAPQSSSSCSVVTRSEAKALTT